MCKASAHMDLARIKKGEKGKKVVVVLLYLNASFHAPILSQSLYIKLGARNIAHRIMR